MRNLQLSMSALAAAVCFLGSCNSVDASKPLDTYSVQSIKKSGNNIECKYTIDYPKGDDSLSIKVAQYISSNMGKAYLPLQNLEDESDAKKYPLYSGATADGNALVNYYANGTMAFLKDQVKELSGAGMQDIPGMSYEMTMSKTEDNPHYLTYETTTSAFLGGAHGTSASYAVNIAKATGHVLAQTVDTLQLKALQPLLREGVLSYLHKAGDTEVSDKTLNDQLFIENGVIPMPAYTPCLTKDGVRFVYQQYEIGPYAIGMPTFTVPYAKIRQYLTKEASELVAGE